MQSQLKNLLPPSLVAALYTVAVAFTKAYFMGDSGGYVASILAYAGVGEYAHENPAVNSFRGDNVFWNFGHLLWRPFGLLLFKVFTPLSSLVVGPDPYYNLLFQLMSANFVAGLLSVLLLYFLLDKLTGRRWLALFLTTLFIFSYGFLNYAQTGTSYIPGLAFLIAALYLLIKDKGNLTRRTAIGAGLACAAAVSIWVPYLLVVPATIAAPFILFDLDRRQKLLLLWALGAFFVATGTAYLTVMAVAGVYTPADFRDWIGSRGVHIGGVARVVFSLPRSFIYMGSDGVLFKRFLLHDPFNPVSMVDLVRFSLWKLVLFYLGLAALVITLLFSSSRRMLWLLAAMAGPLLLFAIRIEGGAVERYLLLYPAVFMSLAWSLGATRAPRALQALPVMFFLVAALANSTAMAGFMLDRQNQKTAERLEAIVPHLKPNSWLVTTNLQDELVNFQASFPFHPANQPNTYRLYQLVVLNTDQTAHWREEFGAKVQEAWAKGGDAWLSKRLFSAKPEAAWNWVEGDDPRVSWNDIYKFFSQFETGALAGGADGFVLLEKSERNANLLNSIALHHKSGLTAVAGNISRAKSLRRKENSEKRGSAWCLCAFAGEILFA